LASLAALAGSCSCCLWFATEHPRFSQDFDIGGGRTLRVWSVYDAGWDYSPLMIWYRVDQGTTELVHKTFLEHDDGGEYHFNAVFAEGGRLACVYEVARARVNSYYLLIYDAESGESWPRLRDDETEDMPGVLAKWRARYRRLKAANPGLPAPEPFDE
jgi:hypothetical protein